VAGASVREGDALEFVRFCHRRKHVGWPELYDEMCAVAGRGLYRGYGAEELAGIGIGLGLFQMPALAGLVARVVAEDAEQRRRIADSVRTVVTGRARSSSPSSSPGEPAAADRGLDEDPEPAERSVPDVGSIRLAVPAGA
ncbi:MAG TPA: hypothetical protein VFP22_07015, partial [Candidatus Limnocylindrales bacterium]|nr:hypothetical protein [Candidatus Limnocylindrales bacterium]